MAPNSHFIADASQLLFDFLFEFAGTLEHFRKFGGEALHLLLEGFIVCFLFLNANIASGRENEVLLGDFLGGDGGAETFLRG